MLGTTVMHVEDPATFTGLDLEAQSSWWRKLPLQSFHIGNVVIPNRYLLAPMCRVTNLAYRVLAQGEGAALLSTEMLSSVALMYGSGLSFRMMEFLPEERPLMVQISGTDPDIMLRAAEMVEAYGATMLNLNCGCPVAKVIKGGSGSALLKNPEVLRTILRTLRPRLRIPLTVKMRAGWDANNVNAVEVARMCQDEGVEAVMLHPRTRHQLYEGKADWDLIAQVKHAVRIPVIGNGDVFSAADAHRMLDATGCDAVMIARGAMGNPWIFRQCILEEAQRMNLASEVQTTLPLAQPTLHERRTMILQHFDLLAAYSGQERAVIEFRQQLTAYLKGLPDAAAFRGNIPKLTSREKLVDHVLRFFDNAAEKLGVGLADEFASPPLYSTADPMSLGEEPCSLG